MQQDPTAAGLALFSPAGEDIGALYGIAFFPKPWDVVQECVRQAGMNLGFPLFACVSTSKGAWSQLDVQPFRFTRVHFKLSLHHFLDSSKVRVFFLACCECSFSTKADAPLPSSGLCLSYCGSGILNSFLDFIIQFVSATEGPWEQRVRGGCRVWLWPGGRLPGAQRERLCPFLLVHFVLVAVGHPSLSPQALSLVANLAVTVSVV